MKVGKRARGRRYSSLVIVLGGCAVYDPGLLNTSGGEGGGAGAGTGTGASAGAGTGASPTGGAGASGAASGGQAGTETSGTSGATNMGGTAGLGGAPDGGGGAGDNGMPMGDAGDAGAGGAPVVCSRETVATFCARLDKDCETDGVDNCGNVVKSANCGSCVGLKICGGRGTPGVCGALTDPAFGGVAMASSVFSAGENETKAFDLDSGTKWYSGPNTKSGWLSYQFSGTSSHVVRSYSVTSANDVPARDPKDWQLQGSNDGSTWITVDQQSAQVFGIRYQTNAYGCTNSTAYRWYRLLITANNGGNELQLAELALYGD